MQKFAVVIWTGTCIFLTVLTALNIYAHRDFPQLIPILGLNQTRL
jgi:hypothetical protein